MLIKMEFQDKVLRCVDCCTELAFTALPRPPSTTTTMRSLLLLLTLTWISATGGVAFAGTCQNITVPAYFYPSQPSSQWNSAVNDAPLPAGHKQILIMNPNNGPGRIDQNYVAAVNKVHSAGTGFLVFGYVYTRYGKRSLSSVEADVNKYKSWYNVDGVFVDQTANSPSYISKYYQPLVNYITSLVPGVMLNPGDYPDQAYANITVPSTSYLILNVFESSYSSYLSLAIPSWAFGYPSSLFSHIVYSTTAADLPNALSLSVQRNAGLMYVTDNGLPNPYGSLPSYWSTLTSDVYGGCS
jgi:Spherulation-specific family 4